MVELSIVTTSKNYDRYLEDNILSVRYNAEHNTYKAKVNHVIIDAGSTDETLNLLKKYRSYLCYYVVPGEPQTASLNRAMKIIENRFPETEYIGWLNADDYYEPNWLELSLSALSQCKPDVALTCSAARLVQNSSHFNHPIQVGDRVRGRGGNGFIGMESLCKHGNVIAEPTVLIRFSILKVIKKKYGYYFNPDYNMVQDFELWYRILKEGYKIWHFGGITANYRLHPNRLGRRFPHEQNAERDIIIRLACKSIGRKLQRVR